MKQRLKNLEQYDGRILIGGELEKFADELFSDVSFQQAQALVSPIVSIQRLLEEAQDPNRLMRTFQFRNRTLFSLKPNKILNMWENASTELEKKRALSLLFSFFRANLTSPLFLEFAGDTISEEKERLRELRKIEFGLDWNVIEIRHKEPFHKVREFYENVISVNEFFGLHPDEMDHIHISIMDNNGKIPEEYRYFDPDSPISGLRLIVYELNKLRYLQLILRSAQNGKLSPQLTKPLSNLVFTEHLAVGAPGIYRMVSPNRFEIRVLLMGVLDELEFHLKYATMPPELAAHELRLLQNELLLRYPIITHLIKKWRPDTLSVFTHVDRIDANTDASALRPSRNQNGPDRTSPQFQKKSCQTVVKGPRGDPESSGR